MYTRGVLSTNMIVTKFQETKIRFWNWFVKKAQGSHARVWIAVVAFTESFIFPIPTVIFLIAVLSAEAKRWVYITGFAVFFSVLGGLVGYMLGAFFFDSFGISVIEFYSLEQEVLKVEEFYDRYAFMAVLIGAFTPLPYKLFALSAGFLKINVIAFLLASLAGRALQFFIVAYLVKVFGGRMAKLVFDYFGIIAVAILVIIVFILLL